MPPNILDILKANGVAAPQYVVMHVVRELAQNRAEVAVDAYDLGQSDPRIGRHCEEYLIAIDECIKEGWLYEVIPEEVEQQKLLCLTEAIPSCADGYPGDMDLELTWRGYERCERIHRLLYKRGRSGVRFVEEGDRQTIEVYGEDEATCIERASGQFKEAEDSHALEKEIDGTMPRINYGPVSSPVAVGPWRYSRHEIICKGFTMSRVLTFTYRK